MSLYDDYQPDKTAMGQGRQDHWRSWPSDLRTIYPWHNYEETRSLYRSVT